jgi:hypothetical protein
MKGVTKFLYNINDPQIAEQLQGREEAALDALIDKGIDPKIAKSIMTNPNLFQTAGDILSNEQALLDKKGLDSPKIEKVSSTNELANNSEGGLVIEITSGYQNNPVEKVLLGAKEARDFVGTLPAEEANAAMLALGVLTGGVIKTAIDVAKDVVVNEAIGDTLNDLQKTVASAAAAGAQGIDRTTQQENVTREGEFGHSILLQEGAEFGLEVIGLGAGAGLIKTGIGKKSVVDSSGADSSGSVGSGLGSEGIPSSVTRKDNDFSATTNTENQRKSYIDEEGNLVPANPDGDITIKQHIRGADPAKSNSQYTSTTSVDGNTTSSVKNYGENTIEINTKRLQQDIDAGKVKDVEVIPPKRVQAELQNNVDQAQVRYDVNTSPKNAQKLERAKQDLEHAIRDNECLIKGCVPSEYIQGGQ